MSAVAIVGLGLTRDAMGRLVSQWFRSVVELRPSVRPVPGYDIHYEYSPAGEARAVYTPVRVPPEAVVLESTGQRRTLKEIEERLVAWAKQRPELVVTYDPLRAAIAGYPR